MLFFIAEKENNQYLYNLVSSRINIEGSDVSLDDLLRKLSTIPIRMNVKDLRRLDGDLVVSELYVGDLRELNASNIMLADKFRIINGSKKILTIIDRFKIKILLGLEL